MASQRVTQMSAVTTLGSTDVFYVVTQVTGTDGNNNQITFQDLNNQIGGGGGGGGLTLIQKQTATSDVQDFTFSGLDGDTDGVYRLLARIKNASGSNTKYTLQPNGLTTNQASTFHYDANGIAARNSSTLQLTDDTADIGNGTWINVAVDFWAQKNPNSVAATRQYQGHTGIATTAPAAASAQVAGVWNETATNLTSLVLHAANSAGIANGSTAALYKYAQS